jgi:putative ABC transport system permease protein
VCAAGAPPPAAPPVPARALDDRFRTAEARTDTKGMQAFVAAAIAEIHEVVLFARWLGYLAVLVIALVVANTVFISAESRIGEMGVLETVGMQKPLLMMLIAGEGIGLGMIGGVLGTAVVVVILTVWPVTLGVEGFGIDLVPGVGTVISSLVAALAVGALASVPPAIAVARRPLSLGVKAD